MSLPNIPQCLPCPPSSPLSISSEDTLNFSFEPYIKQQEDQTERENAEWQSERKGEDNRFKTVVCRHWLRSLCQNGERCDFLHKYDPDRMPECRNGADCTDPDCIFKHTTDEDRRECLFYTQGFCIHGPNCRFRHIKLPAEALPDVANFSTPFESKEEDGEDPVPKNAMFKTSMCRHMLESGACPFMRTCHYAHSQEELRTREQNLADGYGTQEELNNAGNMSNNKENYFDGNVRRDTVEVIASSSEAARVTDSEYGQKVFEIVRSLPDRRGPCKYFVVRVPDPTYQYLVVSIKRGSVGCASRNGERLERVVSYSGQYFLILHCRRFKCFQGVARVSSTVETTENGGLGQANGACTAIFSVEWLKLCQLSYNDIMHLAVSENQPLYEAGNYAELHYDVGRQLMELLFLSESVVIDPDQIEVPDHKWKGWGKKGIAEDKANPSKTSLIVTPLRGHDGVPEKIWWVNGPGFIVGCDSYIIDECFSRFVFGMPEVYKHQSRFIHRGTTILLFNMHSRKLMGIFESTSDRPALYEPNAWVKDAVSTSPYPVQIRFRIVCEVPMMDEKDIAALLPDSNERVRRVSQVKMQEIVDKMIDAGGGRRWYWRNNL